MRRPQKRRLHGYRTPHLSEIYPNSSPDVYRACNSLTLLPLSDTPSIRVHRWIRAKAADTNGADVDQLFDRVLKISRLVKCDLRSLDRRQISSSRRLR